MDSFGSDHYSAQKLACAHCREEELNCRVDKDNATEKISDIKVNTEKLEDEGYKMCSEPNPEGFPQPEKSLDQHTQRFTGSYIYQCKLCCKSFTESVSFNYHMVMHEFMGMRKCATIEGRVNP